MVLYYYNIAPILYKILGTILLKRNKKNFKKVLTLIIDYDTIKMSKGQNTKTFL